MTAQIQMERVTYECPAYAAPEQAAGAGFSDWKRASEQLGALGLYKIMTEFDVDNTDTTDEMASGRHAIVERLATLKLPMQPYVFARADDLLNNPDAVFSHIPHGDYYFVSIRPGVHLAHATTQAEILNFVADFVGKHPETHAAKEIFISHNGEALMSAHIFVKNDSFEVGNKGPHGGQNTIYAECTNRNFNAFHRGYTSPEIIVQRGAYGPNRFMWDFRGALQPPAGADWRTTERFTCFGGTQLSRAEMAQHLYTALQCIPHDKGHFLPGYYEVLFEHPRTVDNALGQTNGVRPVFIEALPYAEG